MDYYKIILDLEKIKKENIKKIDTSKDENEELLRSQITLFKQIPNDFRVVCPRCDGAGEYKRRYCAEDDYDMKSCPLCFGRKTIPTKEALKENGINNLNQK